MTELNEKKIKAPHDVGVEGKKMLPMIAVSIMGGFFAFMGLLVYCETPIKNVQMVTMGFGALMSMATGVVSYYFGSSKEGNGKEGPKK